MFFLYSTLWYFVLLIFAVILFGSSLILILFIFSGLWGFFVIILLVWIGVSFILLGFYLARLFNLIFFIFPIFGSINVNHLSTHLILCLCCCCFGWCWWLGKDWDFLFFVFISCFFRSELVLILAILFFGILLRIFNGSLLPICGLEDIVRRVSGFIT